MTLGAGLVLTVPFAAWGLIQPAAPGESSAAARVLPVETVVLQPVESFLRQRRFSGRVVPRRRSLLGFERGGRLIEVLVGEGERVQAGQPLARLDLRRLEAQRADLQAQRARADAQLDEMRRGPREQELARGRARVAEFEANLRLVELKQRRRRELVAEDVISQEELDEISHQLSAQAARLVQASEQLAELVAGTREERVRAQEALVQQLDAALRLIEIELADAVLSAPFAGTVHTIAADVGVVVGAGQTVLGLVETGALEAWVGLPEAFVSSVVPGAEFPLEVDGRQLIGRVRALLPEVDAATRTVTCVLELTGSARADAMARLVLEERVAERGYWLPIAALEAGERELWSCLAVVGEPARVERRQLQVLELQTDRVLVAGDLAPGDRVVVSGIQRLVPGMAVRP